jgi:hypothetical protein
MSKNLRVGKKWIFLSAGFLLFIALFASALIFPSRGFGSITSLGYYQTARLTAGDMGESDSFGSSLAINGEIAIIGAPQDDDFGTNSGSAYVFVYNPAERAWDQVAKLNASDAVSFQRFGASVAICGDTAFVGAPVHSPGGLVYVFERNQGGPDAWGEVRQIQGDEVSWADYFGVSMDASGDLLIVGAYAGGDYDGTAYIFERDQGGPNAWGQVARLVPADNPAYNYFGYSVAISGETAVGGAPGYNGVIGAAYIFERQADQSWLEVAQLTPADGAYQDFFGIAVDIEGDTFAAGSPDHEGVGAVYLFERHQGGLNAWGQTAKLLASDGALGDGFGQDVCVGQNLAFAGATGRQESAGAIYVYARDPGGSGIWDEAFQLTAGEPAPGEGLGNALAVDDLILLAGASDAASENPLAADNLTLLAGAEGATPGGAAYVYNAYSPPADINLMLGPSPALEGAEAVLTGSFSDPDPDESHALSVQWGDGSTTTMTIPLETMAFTLTHTYLDDQPSGTPADPYTLTVAITDVQGGSAWTQLPLMVKNISPSISVGADAYLRLGETLQRWGSFTDPGADTWTGSVDYDDGSGALPLDLVGQDFWLEHTYLSKGTYWVTVSVTDDDRGRDASQFMVVVVDQLYGLYLPFVQR